MRLVQFIDTAGSRKVAVPSENGKRLQLVQRYSDVYTLALDAHRQEIALATLVSRNLGEAWVDYETVIAERRLLAPLDHPDPAHFIISGTGLITGQCHGAMPCTPLPAAANRSMKMFRLLSEGGKPAYGEIGTAGGLQGRYSIAPPDVRSICHPCLSGEEANWGYISVMAARCCGLACLGNNMPTMLERQTISICPLKCANALVPNCCSATPRQD